MPDNSTEAGPQRAVHPARQTASRSAANSKGFFSRLRLSHRIAFLALVPLLGAIGLAG